MAISDGHRVIVLSDGVVTTSLADVVDEMKSREEVVCHDWKREIHVLRGLGISAEFPAYDVMLAAYLLNPGERTHDMAHLLARRYGVFPLEKSATEPEKVERFVLETAILGDLAASLDKELKDNGLRDVLEKVEMPTVPVLAEMERYGVRLDAGYLEELSGETGRAIDKLVKSIYEMAGTEFNINSPAQLKGVLFERLAISTKGVRKTEKGGGLSTAAAELEKLRPEHPIVGKILEYRELAKLKSTYIDALPSLVDRRDGRLHARFNQAVTATGRLSSSDPNLQNIPVAGTEWGRRVRDAFSAAPGYTFLAADYSQIELRIAAHLSGEKAMIAAFRNGEDIHRRTAITMWGEAEADARRRIAKVINFGILYGMGPQMLSENAGLSFAEARDYIHQYFALHPAITQYMEEMRGRAAGEGFVETLYGRKRFFRNYHLLDRREKGEAERQAINMPVQGTAADMMKDAMIRLAEVIRRDYGDEARMLIQVHDELVFEVKDSRLESFAGAVKQVMENVIKLDVPILVNLSSGKKWGEMKKMAEIEGPRQTKSPHSKRR